MTRDKKQRIFKLILAFSISGALILMFAPFVIPILLGAIFALALEPTVSRVTHKRGYRKTFIVGLLVAMVLVIAVPVLLSIYKIYFYIQEISRAGLANSKMYANILQLKDQLVIYAHDILTSLNLADRLDMGALSDNLLSRSGSAVAAVSTAAVTQVPEFLLTTVIFCIVVFFFLSESRQIKEAILKTNLLKKSDLDTLTLLLQRSSYTTLVSTLVIGVVQASIVAIGGAATGIGDFVIVFVLTFFVSFIPVIGAAPVAFILSAVAFLEGNTTAGIILLIICGVAGSIDNILRPILVSGAEDDIHPLVALVAIIGAIIIFGFPGLILGPVILGVAVKVIPTLFKGSEFDVKLPDSDAYSEK